MDANQLGKAIVDKATQDAFWDTFWDRLDAAFTPTEVGLIAEEFGRLYDLEENAGFNRSETARTLGRRGGLKGGVVRASRMTPQQRSEAARKAAQARWSKAK